MRLLIWFLFFVTLAVAIVQAKRDVGLKGNSTKHKGSKKWLKNLCCHKGRKDPN